MVRMELGELERLREIERTVRARIEAHDRTVQGHGGVACGDDYCRTFKPLLGMRVPN